MLSMFVILIYAFENTILRRGIYNLSLCIQKYYPEKGFMTFTLLTKGSVEKKG